MKRIQRAAREPNGAFAIGTLYMCVYTPYGLVE